jgi:hypothetical protein
MRVLPGGEDADVGGVKRAGDAALNVPTPGAVVGRVTPSVQLDAGAVCGQAGV